MHRCLGIMMLPQLRHRPGLRPVVPNRPEKYQGDGQDQRDNQIDQARVHTVFFTRVPLREQVDSYPGFHPFHAA